MGTEHTPDTTKNPAGTGTAPTTGTVPTTGTGTVHAVGARAGRAVRVLYSLLTGRPISLYAVAVLRIGYGLLYLVFLLREFPHRDEIWGPGSPWTPELARELFHQTGWASFLTLSDSRVYFELCYALALVTSALFLLGWRTRVVSVLFAVVVASFHARAIFATDGGDNLVLLMAMYLVLTACGRRWSLDARRTRLATARAEAAEEPKEPGEAPEPGKARMRGVVRVPGVVRTWRKALARGGAPRPLRDARRTLTTVLHNCGVLVIAAQVCFLYGAAGLYKVQGGTWGAGTALHYVLHLELFRPWPALSQLVDDHAMLIAVIGYLTVLLQVAFPFVLFSRLKYPVLGMLLGMHTGIAVVMGLPLFSGAMIIADAVFLPDRFYAALGELGRQVLSRARSRWSRTGRAAGGVTVPPQARPDGSAAVGQPAGDRLVRPPRG